MAEKDSEMEKLKKKLKDNGDEVTILNIRHSRGYQDYLRTSKNLKEAKR